MQHNQSKQREKFIYNVLLLCFLFIGFFCIKKVYFYVKINKSFYFLCYENYARLMGKIRTFSVCSNLIESIFIARIIYRGDENVHSIVVTLEKVINLITIVRGKPN